MAPTRPPSRPALLSRIHMPAGWVGMAVLVLVLAGIAAACDTSDPPAPGEVQGRVTGEGAPLAGITVELTGPVNRVSQSDGDGRFSFPEVPVGAYVVSIRELPPDAAFPAISRTATVTAGSTLNVEFQGSYIRTASISGRVRSQGQGVAGVTVGLAGPDQATSVTSGDGAFAFSALRAGAYEVEISGYPENITFPSTRTTVDLQPGQAHEATFDGIPEVTATVALAGLQRVLADGSLLPADPTALEGRVQVSVLLDRQEDTPDSLTLSLGSQVVATQRFVEGDGGQAGASPLPLTFAMDTRAWDPATGVPRFRNGEFLLTARLATREGGASAAVASAQVRLVNRDSLVATVQPERGPVLSSSGQSWIGGELEVRVLPILYTQGRSVTTMTLELRSGEGELVAQRSVVGEAPFLVRFPVTPGVPGSLAGHLTGPGPGDRFVVSSARYGDGAFFPILPLAVTEPVRIDQVAPQVEAFRLPRQQGTSLCCLDNWVGAGFPFTQALQGLSDPGVGQATVTFHAGPAGSSDSELAELDPVTVAGSLSPTSGNQAYRVVARLADALGNTRLVPLGPSAGNALEGPLGAVFGVDAQGPLLRLARGGGTLGDRAVNPSAGSAWALVGEEAEPSGFGPLPLVATVRRVGPGDPPGGQCVFPEGSESCTSPLRGWTVPLPDDPGPGYFRLEARAVDRGGNPSSVVTAWAIRDGEVPEVTGLFLGAPPAVGAPLGIGMDVRDNLDLDRARLVFRAQGAAPGGGDLRLPAPVGPAPLGTPWTGDLQREASVQLSLPYLLGVQVAGGGEGGTGAAGPVHPFGSLEARAWDAAGNLGTRSLGLPSPPAGALQGFDAGARGAGGAVTQWRLEAASAQVCREGESCGGGVPSSLALEARATWGSAEAPIPFERVHFLVLGAPGEAMAPAWLGSVTTPTPDAGGMPGARWTLNWAPPAGSTTGSWQVVAVGVDASGNTLLTATPITVEVRGETP